MAPDAASELKSSKPLAIADLHAALNTVHKPLNTLAERELCPGTAALEKINAGLKSGGGAGFKELRTFDDHPSAYVALAQNRVDGVLNTLATLGQVSRG
mgnify:CR=1 FL=1